MRRKGNKPMGPVGYITVTVTASREGDMWVGICQELGVSTFDESLDTLLKELKVLILQHLNSLEKNGARADFFKKHGIRLHGIGAAVPPLNIRLRSGTVVTRLTQRVPALVGT
jgi:predicted RNase H-like HicB family nuclease